MMRKHAIRFAVGALGGLMAVGIVFAAVPHHAGKETGILEEAGQTYDDEKKQIALSNCTVTISQDSYESDGTEKKPEVTVKNGNEVVPSSEYTTAYSDNVNAGTATVTISANYDSSVVRGSVTKTFTITEKVQEDNFEWNISDDGKLTVTGSCLGKLYTEETTDSYGDTVPIYPWYEYREQIKSAYINVTGLTDMQYMFAYCYNLSSVDLSDLDTSKVTNMANMFCDCDSLSSVDVSGFDTSNVTDMSCMFYSCNNLSSVDLSSFDTGNVTNMDVMFMYCERLSSVDVSGFDTSNVTDMSYMFEGCSSLSSVDVSSFNTSNVTDMSDMFEGCSNLSSVDVSSFNTSNVWNMSYMFYGCERLSSVDVSGFDTSNVCDMSYMFYGCESLSSVDVSGFDTSNVTDMRMNMGMNMQYMFANCKSLSSVDVSGFDASNPGDVSGMFENCSNLTELIVDPGWWDAIQATDDMFSGCVRVYVTFK